MKDSHAHRTAPQVSKAPQDLKGPAVSQALAATTAKWAYQESRGQRDREEPQALPGPMVVLAHRVKPAAEAPLALPV